MIISNPLDLHFVLIRGLLREKRHWGKFLPLLQQRYPNARISTPEVPGNGELWQQTSPTTISGMTDALRTQVDIEQPLVLLTISMGGMVATDWMARFPLEIKSSILINTSLANVAPFYQRLRWQNYLKIAQILGASVEMQEKNGLQLTSNLHSTDETVLQNWIQWHRQYPPSAHSAFNQLLASARFRFTDKPRHPILLLGSQQDRLVDPRCTQNLHRLWHADLFEHPTAGHDLPLDDPQWVIDRTSDWLASV